MLTDPTGGGRQRVIHDHRFKRVVQPVLLVQLKEARNVHVNWAAVLAWRQGEIAADAGATAFGADVVLELVAEMTQRGQY